ncbi:MAG: ATP-binding protein [Phycisphaerales bacterium]
MLALQVIAGPDAGRVHALPEGEPQLLGRSTEALGSTDPAMSRRHAELTPSGGEWFVRDLHSTGGTWINGERAMGRVALREGDHLRCGDTVMSVVRLAPGAEAAAGDGFGLPVGADPQRLQAIGETVATISHSVKNILQGLRSGADAVELALRKGDLEMAREGWPIVARNLDRVSWLVMNMLAFAKERPLEIAETDLGALVRETADLMRATAQRRRAKLRVEVEEPMPPAPIDANAVHQVLLNLLSNAIEAVPERAGHVAVRARHEAARARFVVEVEDDGPGVPAAQRPRLFEAFSSSKGQRGTGLGLAVARKLVEQHGGAIAHADASPHGTVIRVELPADRGDPDSERTRGPVPGEAPPIAWDSPDAGVGE